MNKYLKFLAIPLAVTVLGGCAPFHNAIRNVRHSLERVAKKKDLNRKKLVAHGFECGNLDTATRKAISEARQQLREKGIDAEIETIPKAPEQVYWPDYDNRTGCVIAVAYEDPKPVPKPQRLDKTLPTTVGTAMGAEAN